MIVGIDEVGRGAWAGPLVVGAVLLGGARIDGLTDSKKLTKKQREMLDIMIRQQALGVGLGWVSARVIDQIGLSSALKLAAERALLHIRHEYKEIIIDGTIKLVNDSRVTLMKKADLLVPSVSAASIVAKVARDNYMKHLDGVFQGYGFSRHVGYGTAMHQRAIATLGAAPIHRLSYMPLQGYDKKRVRKQRFEPEETRRSTKEIGNAGEEEVVRFLRIKGHSILARNWRTKYCEIDIVSQKGDTVYFTEVKYRKSATFGGGIDAITPRKQQQMAFAAELFAAKYQLKNSLRLSAAAVTGWPPSLQAFIELV